MSRTSAQRRASRESSTEQHPRAPSRIVAGFAESARWTPVTSWPASRSRAAATAESTPPLIAAKTLMGGALVSGTGRQDDPDHSRARSASRPRQRVPGAAGALDDGTDRLDDGVD